MKTYLIKKGKHSSFHIPKLLWNTKAIELKFRFNSSCIYTTDENNNQNDWNKLFGYSRGFHHTNSVRIGWRWNPIKQKIEIAEYYYVDKRRVVIAINLDINLNEEYKYILRLDNGCKLGYMLFPYFGGNERAKNDITIEVGYTI